MFNEKTMEGPGTSTSEENVGTMLPTIGLNGEPVVQKDVKPAMLDKLEDDVEDMEDDNNVLKLSESVIDYINDINRRYDTDVQEGVKEVIDGYESDVTVSPEIKNLIVEITTKRAKMKKIMDNKNTTLDDKKAVIDLKRDIIFLQQKLNKLTKKASPELREEVTKIKHFAEQEILDNRGKMVEEIVDYKKPEEDNEKEDEEEVKESVDDIIIESDDDEKKKLPPELKRLDVKRGRLEKLKDELRQAREKFKETGERRFENKIKGLTANIEKLQKEIEADEKKVAKHNEEATVTEAANMEDEIKPIVEKLERKGYKVKYASPGHKNLRKKEDKEPDGKYYGKLYSDARVMFDKVYDFPSDAPKYWHWREVDGCSYLDITPLNHKESDGSIDEAFAKWKENYMNSLRKFVDDLKDDGSKKVEESVDDYEYDELIEESVDDFSNEELFEEAFDPYVALGALGLVWVAGMTAYSIVDGIKSKNNFKKLEKILFEEEDFISPKDMKTKKYKGEDLVKYLKYFKGPKTETLNDLIKNADAFYLMVYYYKDKPIFCYLYQKSIKYHALSYTVTSKFRFSMIDKKMEKYEYFYIAFVCRKLKIGVYEANKWIKEFLEDYDYKKKQSELPDVKEIKESLDEFSDNLMIDIFERMGFDELSFEDEIITESVDLETSSSKTIIDELNDLLS